MRFIILLALTTSPLNASPALAASRTYGVTTFDRIRVEGPFDVRLSVGGAPAGGAIADQATLDELELDVEGTTLIVRMGVNGWGEQDRKAGPAPVVTVSTPALAGASVIGGGRLAITGTVRGDRLDIMLSGGGTVGVDGIAEDQVDATLLGPGTIRLAGRAARARLASSGAGTIAADPLSVGDLTVSLDGDGETRATARFTAAVRSTGLGRVVVAGPAACTVTATAGGPVQCGKVAPP